MNYQAKIILVVVGLLLSGCGPTVLAVKKPITLTGHSKSFPEKFLVTVDGKNGPEELLRATRKRDGRYVATDKRGESGLFRLHDIDRDYVLIELIDPDKPQSFMVAQRDGNRLNLASYDARQFAIDHVLPIQPIMKGKKVRGHRFGGDGAALLEAMRLLVSQPSRLKFEMQLTVTTLDEAAALSATGSRPELETQPADLWKRAWRPATTDEVGRVKRLNLVENKIDVTRDIRVETTDLVFYDNVKLLRVIGDWQPSNLHLYFLQAPDGTLTQLTGKSGAIHTFNRKHKPRINATTARHYAWFFGFFLRAKDGPFLVVESPRDTFIPKANKLSDDKTRRLLLTIPKPMKCRAAEKAFDCKGVVYYSNAMFEVTQRIFPNGSVEMLSDKPVAGDLPNKIDAPIAHQEIKNLFRQNRQIAAHALETPGLTTNHRTTLKRLADGHTVEINRATIPFLSGIGQRLVARCRGSISSSDIGTLVRFGVSGASNLFFGGDYSNKNLGKAIGSMGSNMALTALGNKVGDRITCSRGEAGEVAGLIARSVRANERAGIFMPTCERSFSAKQCNCLAKIAGGVIPDIQRRPYDRGVIKEMIGRNPLLGFQVGFVCQITRY